MTPAIDDKNARNAAVDQIIQLILDGSSLREAVKITGLSMKSFHQIVSGDREAGQRYAHAMELRGDVLADEIIGIADKEPDAAKARNQITARQWLAGKLNKRYGDRVDLNVTQAIDVGSTLAEARARLLRPVSYQLEASDAQVIDMPRQISTGAPDKQSVDVPGPDDVPDIFS